MINKITLRSKLLLRNSALLNSSGFKQHVNHINTYGLYTKHNLFSVFRDHSTISISPLQQLTAEQADILRTGVIVFKKKDRLNWTALNPNSVGVFFGDEDHVDTGMTTDKIAESKIKKASAIQLGMIDIRP